MRARVSIAVFVATAVPSCLPTLGPPPTTWTAPVAFDDASRYGVVESVQQIVQPGRGGEAAGAIAGAVVGNYLFHGDVSSTLLAAAAGAAIGGSAGRERGAARRYRVTVRFDDGACRVFVFGGSSPFWAGDSVVLTPRGLLRS